MVLIYEKYGNLYTEGWKRVISPNNHPKMSNRIERLGNRMTRWSGNRVQVGGATVYVNALPVVTPISFGEYSSCRRAYLVAGNLARLTHACTCFDHCIFILIDIIHFNFFFVNRD